MSEVWLPIPGYENYLVSTEGNILSMTRLEERKDGRGKRLIREKPVTQRLTKTGYSVVTLSNCGKHYTALVHKLVMLAFVGQRPEGMEIAHNDGCPTNNRLRNLRYATSKQNKADMVLHGTRLRGERKPNARFKEHQVLMIRAALDAGTSQIILAQQYGVDQATISLIKRRKTWAHIAAEETCKA